MDLAIYYAVRLTIALVNLVPLRARKSLVGIVNNLVFFALPSLEKVSKKNMQLVFPSATALEVGNLLFLFKQSFARFIIDCLRFEKLSESWYANNIKAPFNTRYSEIKAGNNGKGLLVVGGHMGSIELQAFVSPFLGRKFSFVARPFKSKRLDQWWLARRQKFGNLVIGRNGAVSKMIENINAGIDVGILIDQNITRKHAIFIDWFGREAATTFAAGLVAVETGSRVVLSAIVYEKDDTYFLHEKECDISHILQDQSMDKNSKIVAITRLLSIEYQAIIKQYPSEWFWIHRRWKTAPEGKPEDFYSRN